mgnify:CR=1 FL=1
MTPYPTPIIPNQWKVLCQEYMAAKVAALNHKPAECFLALDQAFELGFEDINRLKSDPDFKSYHEDERFKSLLNTK